MSKKLTGKAKQKARAKAFKAKNALNWKSLKSPTNLISFYWGYKADDHANGFEFSTATCLKLGMTREESNKLGVRTKKVVDHQLEVLKTNTTMEVYGLSREDFIAEEHYRMLGTTQNLNIITSKPFKVTDIIKDLIIWVCAVSTCVAAGLLEQDEWNGDKFHYMQTDDANFRQAMGLA